ncbi:MAG: coenzyme F420-0:L-glutamate ligase [Gammaproteobacteria bacterium]|nr:coenzyme F420-0:L-glutamate ligase [Gammaproteobacteria bacterium]
MSRSLAFAAVPGLPEITPGSDLAALIRDALRRAAIELAPGDALVVAQKAVSKADNRYVDLAGVEAGAEARELAARVRKDPRFVQVVLDESSAVLRAVPNILITRHRCGYVMANAGIDRSNVPGAEPDGAGRVLLLPIDCDASAAQLSQALGGVPVIISDSFGRPWRQGVVNVALGVAGLPALVDLRGATDREGRVMQTTQVALADAVAAGAGLVMGEGAQGTPVVIARGLDFSAPLADGRALLRPLNEDLFG